MKIENKIEIYLLEGKMKTTSEGFAYCPDCNNILDFDRPGDRDTESLGGDFIQYWKCSKCKNKFHSIEDRIYPE